ncbi:hypothetical protein UFOVP1004_50 [uncultured Caudovirales phage]|uniref:Uncharacterized protein n=1 Tax=uncultured Caudovirales phage TaxID=2100421 RepID=A0A6J5QE93_9CAUD|nr:hypothetical protein UFOVP1004_50 [uncultured Caudovirales phage]
MLQPLVMADTLTELTRNNLPTIVYDSFPLRQRRRTVSPDTFSVRATCETDSSFVSCSVVCVSIPKRGVETDTQPESIRLRVFFLADIF